jgi:hypothetical protein
MSTTKSANRYSFEKSGPKMIWSQRLNAKRQQQGKEDEYPPQDIPDDREADAHRDALLRLLLKTNVGLWYQ